MPRKPTKKVIPKKPIVTLRRSARIAALLLKKSDIKTPKVAIPAERKKKKEDRSKPTKKIVKKTIESRLAAPKVKKASIKETKESEENEMDESFEEREMQSTGRDSGVTEVIFSFDATGSMMGALEAVRKEIREISERLLKDVPKIRLGFIAHGDYSDGPNTDSSKGTYFMDKLDLSNDVERIVKWINAVKPTGGGDEPENYEQVLAEAHATFSWSDGSTRALVLFGDAGPHSAAEAKTQMSIYNIPNPREIDWKEEADNCWKKGIKIYGVQCLANARATKFYKSISARTLGYYVNLSNFNVVKDMILAVCFREVSQERFEQFEKEVIAEGRMHAAMKKMFRQVSGEVSKNPGASTVLA